MEREGLRMDTIERDQVLALDLLECDDETIYRALAYLAREWPYTFKSIARECRDIENERIAA